MRCSRCSATLPRRRLNLYLTRPAGWMKSNPSPVRGVAMRSADRLHLAPCSFAAAAFACRWWHYSHSLPAAKRVLIGVWESGTFIGAIVFSRGNCPNIGRPFGLEQSQIAELTRVALRPHQTPTSRIVAIAVRLLRRQSPGLKLLVSFADREH